MMQECCDINKIVKELYNSLYAYTLGKIDDKSEAEDIVQEVMFRLSNAYMNNTQIDNIRAWLYQTTRHVIADHFRSKFKSSEFITESVIEKTFPNEDMELMVSDAIIPMIKLLSEEYSIPLMWSDIDNIPQKEIAEKLGIGLSAAKMRVQRARKKLHELFIECCEIEYDKNGNFVHCTIKESCTPLQEINKK